MPASFVTIDTTDDFDVAPPTSKMNGFAGRTLLLAPPSIATKEDKLRDLFGKFQRSTTDLQMLDRLTAGLVSLPSDTYDYVLVLTDTDGARRSEALQLLGRDVYTTLVPSMRAGAKLQTEDSFFGASDELEAILAGLVKKDGGFEKPNHDKGVAVPLRFKAKKNTTQNGTSVNINGSNGISVNNSVELDDDDDELIDEDNLLSEADMQKPVVQPPECRPKPGKRRRACKDCTCGLAAEMQGEDKERRAGADANLNALKLGSSDLNELDFTVKGKTGSCGSCALGDAFRCAGCPYIGLPAFKPGEEVRLLNDVAQL